MKNRTEKDWKHWIDKQARELDEAAKSKNQRKVYQMVKLLAGKMTKSSPLVKDKHGNLVDDEAKKLERWAEHFSEILNPLPPSVVLQDVPVEYEELDVKLDPPSREEIARAVNRAPGFDDITGEMLKAGGEKLAVTNMFGGVEFREGT